MACSKCKEKKQPKKVEKTESNSVDKWGTSFVIIGIVLAIYGLISLIKDIVSLL